MRPRFNPLTLAVLAGFTLVACGERPEAPSESSPVGPASTPANGADQASPDSCQVSFETSRGTFVVAVTRALSPKGVDRFHQMVVENYFTGVRFFRVVPGFVAQFGMHGDPETNLKWERRLLQDEPVRLSNARG